MDELLQAVRRGDRRAVARALTVVERGGQRAQELVMGLFASTGKAHIVGVTGSPGSGKSTLVNQLARQFRERDLQVGIIAVDPSSPFTGGALLGDRVRMQDLAGDEGVFIRSMASRGNLGGLARATTSAVKVLDAAGFDIVLVETVGAGQAEVSIASTAHTTIVVEAPGMGDEIQSIKAGILEIADILVVNKADRPGAARATKALRLMLHMGQQRRQTGHGENGARAEGQNDGGNSWTVRVFETVAVDGKGIPDVAEEILAHRAFLHQSGQLMERESERVRHEVEQIMQNRVSLRLEEQVSKAELNRVVEAVTTRKMDPYTAASTLLTKLFPEY